MISQGQGLQEITQGQGLQEIIACSAFLRYNVDNNVLLQGKERQLCVVLLDMWE